MVRDTYKVAERIRLILIMHVGFVIVLYIHDRKLWHIAHFYSSNVYMVRPSGGRG